MSRIRSIKPDAFESLSLARVPIEARWTFAGIWTMADDDARLPDSPALIRSKVYPVEDIPLKQITAWVDALVEIGSLCRYKVGPESYLHIPSWKRHQVINKPTPSRLPECPKHAPGRSAREALHRPRMEVTVPTVVDPEPPRRCPAHLSARSAPRCGACKEARITHEEWVKSTAERKAKEAEMAANTLCGSAACTCDHADPCDYGWITVQSRLPNGAPVEAQAKCPACFGTPEPSTTSGRPPRLRDAREHGADYADARSAAAGDR